MSNTKKAADLIKKLFENVNLDQGQEYYNLFSGWERTVGTDLASHSVVKEIERGTLIVAVDHPGWAQMIGLRKRTILSACRKQYPDLEIRDLRVVLDRREVVREKKKPEEETPAPMAGDEPIEPVKDRGEFDDLLHRLEQAVEDQENSSH